MTTKTKEVKIRFAGLEKPGRVPSWASSLWTDRCTLDEVSKSGELPGLIVLRAGKRADLFGHEALVRRLSDRLRDDPSSCRLVVDLADETNFDPEDYRSVIQLLGNRITNRLDLSCGRDQLAATVYEALAKYQTLREEQEAQEDPLSSALEVQETRAALVSPKSGRLDATRIAAALGMSVARLATLIGKSRATVNKTPDAPALQVPLRPYERILRLGARLPQEKLLAWLEAPNQHLDNQSPRSLIEDGRAGIVADLVEDALTGQPT